MRLVELHLRNFRQFYGDQVLKFSEDASKNVTVIHGYNGAGKTALLNAFVWCLYGETTPDLEAAQKLVNERAIAEAEIGNEVVISVRLRYIYGGLKYIAERKAVATREVSGEVRQSNAEVSLFRISERGEQERLDGGQLYIDRQLPVNLYPFFFFNGERVETLASPDAYERVEDGVKTLLDVEIYERSMRHLRDTVSAALSKELKQFGTTEMQELVDKETSLKERRAEITEITAALRENIEACSTEIEKIEQRQASIAVIQEFTSKRAEVRAQLDGVEGELRTLRASCARCLSRDGYLAFADPVFSRSLQLVKDARQRGELPAKVKPQFVDDLLSAHECVCGRPIESGSHEEVQLLEWKKHTGLADLEEAVSHTNAALAGLRKRRESYFDEVDRLQGQVSDLYSQRRRLNDQLGDLERKIGDRSHGEEPEELEQRRQEAVRRRDDFKFDLRDEERRIADIDEQLASVEKDLEKIKSDNEKVALVQRQKHAVNRIADALERLYQIQKDDVRIDLSKLVSDTWTDAAVKDYQASVSSEFRLVLTKKVRGSEQPVHGASTGEKQVLALSFVGSLVKKARMNLEESEGADQGMIGGDYPLVMDSPFGALEDDYRRKVAEWVPLLASQVVIMASKTQWRQEVETAVGPRIGKAYILELRTPKESAERTILLDGKEYPYVVQSDEAAEFTLIQEVK